jgi:hypothetical protein
MAFRSVTFITSSSIPLGKTGRQEKDWSKRNALPSDRISFGNMFSLKVGCYRKCSGYISQ